MATATRLALRVGRWTGGVRQIRLRGIDISAYAPRVQVRLTPDTPGTPLIDLPIVTNPLSLGIRILPLETIAGVPTSTIALQFPKSVLGTKMPAAAETGDDAVLAWELTVQIDAVYDQAIAYGDFIVTAGVVGSDTAVAQLGGGRSQTTSAGDGGGGTITIGDTVVEVTIDGIDLLAPLVTAATTARDQSKIYRQQIEAAAVGFSITDRWYLTRRQVVTADVDVEYRVEQAVLIDGSRRDFAPPTSIVASGLDAGGFTVGAGADRFYLLRRQVLSATVDATLQTAGAVLLDGSLYPPAGTITKSGLGPIVCIGDSLTADSYPGQLAALTGREVINLGIGGQQGYQIAGRMGAIGIPLTIANGRFVAGGNSVTAINGTPVQSVYAASPAGFNATNLQLLSAPDTTTRTIAGTCGSVHGILTRTATAGAYTSSTAETYTFTPDADAVLPAGCPAGTMFVADYAYEDATHVFWPFRNNYSLDAASCLAVLLMMTDRLPHKRYIVMSVINGAYPSEYAGQANYRVIRAIEDGEANTYPGRFLSIRRLLIDTALTRLGLAPTSQDMADIANDTIPTQLRKPNDQIHPAYAANSFIAASVNGALTAKGY